MAIIVSDHHDRAGRRDSETEERKNIAACARIKIASRLVRQNQLRPHHERARDRHPLLLTTGKITRQPTRKLSDPEPIEQLSRTLTPPAKIVGKPNGQQNVLPGTQLGNKLEGLKDEPDRIATKTRKARLRKPTEPRTGHRDRPFGRLIKATDEVQERRFARTRGTDDRDELAPVDLQVDTIENRPLRLSATVHPPQTTQTHKRDIDVSPGGGVITARTPPATRSLTRRNPALPFGHWIIGVRRRPADMNGVHRLHE
jgi:hypothetical protein